MAARLFSLLAALVLAMVPPAAAPGLADTPQMGRSPTAGAYSTTWHHLIRTEPELRELGGGDMDRGMSLLGGEGYQLMAVTSVLERMAPQLHIFKRTPWTRPMPRPTFEFRRLDGAGLEALGEGDLEEGWVRVEEDGWQLKAFTTNTEGRLGWYYFQRLRPEG
jgi:hypothetical protein